MSFWRNRRVFHGISTEIVHRMRDRPVVAASLATVALSIVFMVLPDIDIATARAFYLIGVGFPVGRLPAFQSLRALGLFSMNLSVGLVFGFTLLRCLVPAEWQPPILFAVSPRRFLFLAASLAVGPGLVANLILKDHWGRARPIDTTLFGGAHPFSLPWVISDGCERNCSFISGEGSGSFWFLALACVVSAHWRRPVARAALAWTIVMSLNRLAFGGHYLSDVLIGWGLMAIVILAARDLILIRHGDWLDAIVASWIDRISDPTFHRPTAPLLHDPPSDRSA